MTISTSSNTAVGQGNGLTTSFSFSFPVPNASELAVYFTDVGGAITPVPSSQYSVNGIGNANGGSVIYPLSGSPIASGTTLTIQRVVPYVQLTDLVNQSGYYPNVVEGAMDYLTMQTQQLAQALALTLSVPLSATPPDLILPPAPDRALGIVGFDANGNAIIYPLPASVGAGNMTAEIGQNGRPGFKAGTDFVAGTTNTLTLSKAYGSIANVLVCFDGVYQEKDSYILSGTQITFGSYVGNVFVPAPIPASVTNVDIVGGTTLSAYIPATGSVGPSQLSAGAVTDVAVAANAAIQTSKLSYTQGGAGSVARTVLSKLQERISVKDFGCKGDGATDDTANFQAAMTYVLGVGGILYVPAGTYKLSAPLSANYSALTAWPAARLSIIGDGASNTILSWSNGASGGLAISGGTSGSAIVGQYEVKGLTLAGGNSTGLGLTLSIAAFVSVTDVVVENFLTGFELVDIISTNFRECRAAFCNGGIFSTYSSFSPPNALSFWDCHFTNNAQYAMDIHNPTTLTFFGGSIESNFGAGSNVFGVRILTQAGPLDGAQGATFIGTYFENNGSGSAGVGIADLWFNNSVGGVAAMSIIGCNFNRQNQFCTNCIRIDTAGGFSNKLALLNNSFLNFSPYVASASRPNVQVVSSTDPIQLVELGNTWSAAVESPNWSGQNSQLPASLIASISQATAWVVFNGATGAILQSFNVSGVTRSAAGTYTLNFARQLQNGANVSVASLSSAGFYVMSSQNAAGINFQTQNPSQVATDFGQVAVAVFGGNLT